MSSEDPTVPTPIPSALDLAVEAYAAGDRDTREKLLEQLALTRQILESADLPESTGARRRGKAQRTRELATIGAAITLLRIAGST